MLFRNLFIIWSCVFLFHLFCNVSFCFIQTLSLYLDVSILVLLSINLNFVSEANLKSLASRPSWVKSVFPIRAVVIYRHGSDSSMIFGVMQLWKCAFSWLIRLTHSCVCGKWNLDATWAWQILSFCLLTPGHDVILWCAHGQKLLCRVTVKWLFKMVCRVSKCIYSTCGLIGWSCLMPEDSFQKKIQRANPSTPLAPTTQPLPLCLCINV